MAIVTPVPEIDVRRRYDSGLRNFFRLYRPVAHAWWFYDGSLLPPALIARQADGLIAIAQPELFAAIQQTVEINVMSTHAKNLTLTEQADAAFQQAAMKVIERARQTGTPVIVWENGRVTERSPEELMPMLKSAPSEGGRRKAEG